MKRIYHFIAAAFVSFGVAILPCYSADMSYETEEKILASEKEELRPSFFSDFFKTAWLEGMGEPVSKATRENDASQSFAIDVEKELKYATIELDRSKMVLTFPSSVRSKWADNKMIIGGYLSATEWGDAGKILVPGGYLMVKNDDEFVYIALDLTSDTFNDPGTEDYFWFSIDVDQDQSITPYRDTNYGLYVDQPNRLARQYYLGPGVWTTILQEESPSACHIGFGSSPNKATAHRVWEIKLSLAELGIDDLTATDAPPVINFGVRVKSETPSFTYDNPSGFYTDFSALKSIILARQTEPQYAEGSTGSVIGGVGLIPYTQIVDGYGSVDPSYLDIDEAAFGGRLDFIGNRVTMEDLWDAGARKYRVYHRKGSAGSYQPVLQSWSNYRWTGTKYVLDAFGPDDESKYTLQNPGVDYSIDDLLIRWNSKDYASGMHHFFVRFYDAFGNMVPAPLEILSLMVDNYLPVVDIVEITHDDYEIPACSIEEMIGLNDGVRLEINVNDPEGHLRYYKLTAHFGEGDSELLDMDTYAHHKNPTHLWSGTPGDITLPASEWVPPYSCAYQFRLVAFPRTTNGYGWINSHTTDTHHVTLMVP